MTLKQFVDTQKGSRLIEIFSRKWKHNRKEEPRSYPLEMREELWVEGFRIFVHENLIVGVEPS